MLWLLTNLEETGLMLAVLADVSFEMVPPQRILAANATAAAADLVLPPI